MPSASPHDCRAAGGEALDDMDRDNCVSSQWPTRATPGQLNLRDYSQLTLRRGLEGAKMPSGFCSQVQACSVHSPKPRSSFQ